EAGFHRAKGEWSEESAIIQSNDNHYQYCLANMCFDNNHAVAGAMTRGQASVDACPLYLRVPVTRQLQLAIRSTSSG
ncbi:TPA: hypothetical protein ACSQ1O_004523, partial [Aeromonas hydrophila]